MVTRKKAVLNFFARAENLCLTWWQDTREAVRARFNFFRLLKGADFKLIFKMKKIFVILVALIGFGIVANAQLRFDKTEIELIVGEEYTLNAFTNPAGQPVNWTSSNTSKATVEGDYGQGKVIAKTSGTLTINAAYEGETISCKVTIYDVPLSGVTIEGVTWAAFNVNTPGTFVEKVTDRGMLYQWNSKKAYSEAQPNLQSFAQGTAWSSENDPCPSGWRLPTLNEVQTLMSKVINPSYNRNGGQIKGRLAVINGQQCVVMKFENNQHLVFWSMHNAMTFPNVSYWTSTPNGSNQAYCFTKGGTQGTARYFTVMLRCVKK